MHRPPTLRRALPVAAALLTLAAAPRAAFSQAACTAGELTIRAGDARLARLGVSPPTAWR